MILIASIAVMGSLLLKDLVSVDMLGLHLKALLFVTQSHKIPPEALFVIVYALIVKLSLTCVAIASIAGGFIFVIMFCMILKLGTVTLGV